MEKGVREIIQSSRFKADIKRIARSGRFSPEDLLKAVERLSRDEPMEKRHRDHALAGEWKGCRELHLRPDWLLIYRLNSGVLELVRTGSHADLFE